MPAQLLLVNPRRKRRARRATSKKRVHRARRRRSTVAAAPRRRRRRYAVSHAVRRVNPRRKHRISHRRRRHNPRMSIGGITKLILPAALGGAGAVALDVGLSYLPASVPDFLKTGPGAVVLKAGAAIGLGWAAGKVLGRDKGHALTAGALTVVAYGLIKDLMGKVAPSVPVSGLSGDYQSYYNPAPMLTGAYMEPGMGAYMSPADQFQHAQMGAYMSPDGM